MLKSLERLSRGYFDEYPCYENTHPQFQHTNAENLASKIQAEIDKFYRPLPLFEDGEPAYLGDEYWDEGLHEIEQLEYQCDGVVVVLSDGWCVELEPGERLKRPKTDTQEQIDADTKLNSLDYCAKYSLTHAGEETASIAVRKHLLYRQRRVDGVE